MRAYTLHGACSSLSRALGLDAFSLPLTVALTGAGGKTSLLFCLAREQRAAGKRVLVYTTTHMQRDLSPFCPEAERFLTVSPARARELLEGEGFAILAAGSASSAEEAKISWPGALACREAAAGADLVLVEADGSRRLPCKAPGPGEPVIPRGSGLILAVQGLSAIGREPAACCHRLDQARPLLSGENITLEDLGRLMKAGYLTPLRQSFPQAAVLPIYHQADTEALARKALALLSRQKEQGGVVSTLFP